MLIAAIGCIAFACLDGYQAITGRRVVPSSGRRSAQRMRNESAIAAVVLLGAAVYAFAHV